MRVIVPNLGTFEGSWEEVSRALALLKSEGVIRGDDSAEPAARIVTMAPTSPSTSVGLPTNENLVYQFRLDTGVSKAVRTQYVSVVEDFRNGVEPKSLVVVTQDDVRAYERKLLDKCGHMLTQASGAGPGALRIRCDLKLFGWSVAPPAICSTVCASFKRQKAGPKARLTALKMFYEFVRGRGLRTDNPVEFVLKRHAKARGKSIERKKYAPTILEARELIGAVRRTNTPVAVGIVMALAKWGRRPSHTLLVHAEDLVGIVTPGTEGIAFADFERVKTVVETLNMDGHTKLQGYLISPIDAEHALFLRDELMPYRQAKWGYAWNEGPLYPGERSGKPFRDDMIQEWILDPAMTYLSQLGTAADMARWKAHLDGDSKTHITPGSMRHFFTTTLHDYGVSEADRSVLRGDVMRGSQWEYMHLDAGAIVAKYRMPELLRVPAA